MIVLSKVLVLIMLGTGAGEGPLGLMPGGNVAHPWQLSADGERLICAVEVLDVRTGDRIAAFPAKPSWFEFSVDDSGDRIAFRGPDDLLEVWDTRSCRRIVRVAGLHPGAMDLSADGSLLLASVDIEQLGPVVRVATGEPVDIDPRTVVRSRRSPLATGYLSKDRSLRTISVRDLIRMRGEAERVLWRARMPRPRPRGIGLTPGQSASKFSGDGARWIRVLDDGTARVVDVKTGRNVPASLALRPGWESASVGQISADGTRAMIAGDGRVSVRDLETNGELFDAPKFDDDGQRFWARMSPSGARIVTWGVSASVEVELWSLPTSAPAIKLADTARAVAWSPDSKRVAIGRDGSVQVFESETGEPGGEAFLLDGMRVNALAFHPTEPVLAVGGSGPGVVLLNTGNEAITRTGECDFTAFNDVRILCDVFWVEFSPDGDTLAVGVGQMGSAHAFETATGKKLWSVYYGGGNPSTLFVRFDATGERVLIDGQTQRTGRIIHAVTGETLVDLSGSDGDLGISPTGNVITLGDDVLDAETLARRYSRHEFRNGGYVLLAPSGHYAGTPDAIRNAWVSVDGQPWPLDCFDQILHDPDVVRRGASGGGAVATPSLPRPPEIVVTHPAVRETRVNASGHVRGGGGGFAPIQIHADSPRGITHFEIERVGGVTGPRIVGASEPVALRRELSFVVPVEWRSRASDLRIRARSRDGTRSKPVRIALRPE